MTEQCISSSKSAVYRHLQLCISDKDFLRGRELHSFMVMWGYEHQNTFASQLIRMYSDLGSSEEANFVFCKASEPNICTWSAVIAAHLKLGEIHKALSKYREMEHHGIKPNNDVFLCIIKGCAKSGLVGTLETIEFIKQHDIPLSKNIVHSLLKGCRETKDPTACNLLFELIKRSGLDSENVFEDQLIRILSSCGKLIDAKRVFEMILRPSLHTWNAIISAHVNLGKCNEAISLFHRMQKEGVQPNQYIFTCVLKACSIKSDVELARLLHYLMVVNDLDSGVSVGNALVDVYSKCGDLEGACDVFDRLDEHDVITWGTMTVSLSQNGLDLAALELCEKMIKQGLIPNRAIFLHVIKSCGNLGVLGLGRLTHAHVLKTGLQNDNLVGSALLVMYADCGNMEDLNNVFDGLTNKDVIAWGAMIGGYVQHGNYELAVQYLHKMHDWGIRPDAVILTNILAACSHAGLVYEGSWHFRAMANECGITPTTTHYNCMIDLLGRSGFLNEAEALLYTMPNPPDLIGWKSLLGCCKTHSNRELAQRCFHAAVESNPHDSAGYALLADIFADVDMLEDADTVHNLRKSASAAKIPGRAWIEIDANVEEFIVGQTEDTKSVTANPKHTRLSRILKLQGHISQLDIVL